MSDRIAFPPLHDPSPGELERRRQHLLSEISREPERRRLSSLSVLPLQLRFVLPAVAAICAAVAAVVFTGGLPGGSGSVSQGRTGGSHQRNAAPTLNQLRRAAGKGMFPGVIPAAKQIAVADAATTLGAPVVLPKTSLVQPSDATQAIARGNCPYTKADSHRWGCWVLVSFPAQSLGLVYIRPVLPHTPRWYRDSARHDKAAQVINLNGVPALEIQENAPGPQGPQSNPGSVEFAVAGTRVVVAGYHDSSTLEAVARSIIGQTSTGS